MKHKRAKGWGIALIIIGVLTIPYGLLLIIPGIVLLIRARKLKNAAETVNGIPQTPLNGEQQRFSVPPGPSYSGGPLFGSWDTSVHLAPGQLFRFGRAVYGNFQAKPLRNGMVEVTGSKGNVYHTSLNGCDCPDFQKRRLPCKHIYSLALSLGYTVDDFYSSYLDAVCSDGAIPRPVVGYSNGLKSYQVHGINPETKRRNKRTVNAIDEADALIAARDAGLMDPIEVDGLADSGGFIAVNDWQRDMMRDRKIALPPSADYYDAKALLSRAENSGASDVPVGLLIFATKSHIPCSLLTGSRDLLDKLLNELPRRGQIALYAAAVLCSQNGAILTDEFQNPVSELCYSFADFAYNDEKLYRALLNNLSSDVLCHPPKSAPIYRAVVNFCSSKITPTQS